MVGYTDLGENSKNILGTDKVQGVYRNMTAEIFEVNPEEMGLVTNNMLAYHFVRSCSV